MDDLVFIVAGEPKGKGRPRFSRKTGRAYTPPQTVKYENLVRFCFTQEYPYHKPCECALGVTIIAYYPIPKSWSKKKKALAAEQKVPKVTKPDADNIIKAVCDGLNGVAWKDDAQIVRLYCYKEYSNVPEVKVIISEVKYEQS